MGNCFGTQVKSESPFNSGANDLSAAISSRKSSNLLVETSRGSTEASAAMSRELSSSPVTSATDGGLHQFSYSDLKASTRNFRSDSLLGEGGFGSVFKGYIDEQTFTPTRPGQGIVIAVKKLNLEGHQGHTEWLTELYYLGALHHPNLVKLVGFCAEDDHRLLVYEFLARGSLENHLFRKGNHHQALSWVIRIKIAIDAARGLAFLHNAKTPVIYRDFKTSNILLDLHFNAKLSDFGLAKDGPTGDKTHVSTRVMGTYGYAAPEYVATGRLTAKSDVYSFGVVLLEMLTGRRVVDKNRPGGEQNLVEWAEPYLSDKRKVLRIIDQKLAGQYSLKGARTAAGVARHCLNQDAKIRPTMKQVVHSLEPLNAKEFSKYGNDSHYQDGDQSRGSKLQKARHGASRVSYPSPKDVFGRQGNGESPSQSHTMAGSSVGRQ